MKASISKFFASLLTIIIALLFIISLATAYLYFTVYNTDNFTTTVGSFIDGDYIKNDASKNIEIISKNYGFDSEIAKTAVNAIDFNTLGKEYFTKFYTSFISGNKELPYLEYDNGEFLKIITDNVQNALRPEIYELEENRVMLADKFSTAIEASVNSFSLDAVQGAISGYGSIYSTITQIGKLFLPAVACLAFFLLIVLIIIIANKLVGSAYSLFLTLFTISLFFTVPLGYLKAQELPSRFNISLGGGYAYINAIWETMIASAANAFAVISGVLLLAILIVSIIAAFKKKKN